DPKRRTGHFDDSVLLRWIDAGGNQHDSIFAISLDVAPPPIQVATSTDILVFDTISPCKNGKDSLITLRNTGCDTVMITDVGNALGPIFSVDSMKLPIIVPPDSSITIVYHFRPRAPGAYNSSHTISMEWKGIKSSRLISLFGRETSSGFAGVLFNKLVDFDTVSACSPKNDTVMMITNIGCDTMRILSGPGILGPEFTFDPLSYPLLFPPGGSITLRIHFHPKNFGSYSASAFFLADWMGYSSTQLRVDLIGTSSRSKAGPLISDTILNFHDVSSCDPFKDSTVQLKNRSCDTLRILSGPTFSNEFGMDSVRYPIVLAPDSGINLRFHYHPDKVGKHLNKLSFITLRAGLRSSLGIDLLGQNDATAAGPLIDPLNYDLGILNTCAPSKDTIVTLYNLGCDTLVVVAGSTVLTGGFTTSPLSFPFSIPPGDSAKIRYMFSAPGTGVFTANPYLITDRAGIQIEVDLHLSATAIRGPAFLSLSQQTILFTPISICTADSSEITYTNSGCDTLYVTQLGTTGDPDFFAAQAGERAVLPGDTIHLKVIFTPQQRGVRGGFATLHCRSLSTASFDTVLSLSGFVTAGSR
ncbi:MAG: hypothetical protein ABI778_12575, partial [Ignavibacteriota bacterium]